MRKARLSKFNPEQRERQLARVEASTHKTSNLRESYHVAWRGGEILSPGTRTAKNLQHAVDLASWASSQRSVATVYHGTTVLFVVEPSRTEPMHGLTLAKRSRYASPRDRHHEPRRLDSRYYKPS